MVASIQAANLSPCATHLFHSSMLQKAGVAEFVVLVEAAGRSNHLLLLMFVLLLSVCCSAAPHGIACCAPFAVSDV